MDKDAFWREEDAKEYSGDFLNACGRCDLENMKRMGFRMELVLSLPMQCFNPMRKLLSSHSLGDEKKQIACLNCIRWLHEDVGMPFKFANNYWANDAEYPWRDDLRKLRFWSLTDLIRTAIDSFQLHAAAYILRTCYHRELGGAMRDMLDAVDEKADMLRSYKYSAQNITTMIAFKDVIRDSFMHMRHRDKDIRVPGWHVEVGDPIDIAVQRRLRHRSFCGEVRAIFPPEKKGSMSDPGSWRIRVRWSVEVDGPAGALYRDGVEQMYPIRFIMSLESKSLWLPLFLVWMRSKAWGLARYRRDIVRLVALYAGIIVPFEYANDYRRFDRIVTYFLGKKIAAGGNRRRERGKQRKLREAKERRSHPQGSYVPWRDENVRREFSYGYFDTFRKYYSFKP